MRWADLDSLNHVNNVVYLRYAAHARTLIEDLPPGPIGQMAIQFKRPILLGDEPVVVESSVDGSQLRQSIGVAGSADEFATVVTDFGGYADPVDPAEGVHQADLALRRTDLADGGRVPPEQTFELFQETRVPYFRTAMPWMKPGGFVVADVRVRYHRDIVWQAEPLVARAWMSRVGNASFAAETQLTTGDQVLASSSAVLVGFDATTQRSRRFDESELAAMRAQLSPER